MEFHPKKKLLLGGKTVENRGLTHEAAPMSSEEKTQILARIAALEYLLEMGYSTWVSQMTNEEIEEFQRDFERRLSTTWVASQVDPFIGQSEFDKALIRDAQQLAVRFWKRVRDREADIRQKRKNKQT